MTTPTEYSGHVTPGGASISREVDLGEIRVEVRKLSVGPMDNNAYVLTAIGSGDAILIDAANDADRLIRELEGLELRAIITTHGHRDHWQALGRIADVTGAPVYIHPADADLVPRPADVEATDGLTVSFGNAEVTLIHNPGHTPGSISVLLGEDHLFTGDTLFPGGPGRTDLAGGDFAQVMTSLEERVFALHDDVWVYPGHGDDTTLGAERPHLGEWRARGW